ncbi:MAG: beta-carotene 15,15'-monooxygenase [Clostridia bacterium]|nr:beta-carotene 15,15'-monooxygenase [Clostridia bacterium]
MELSEKRKTVIIIAALAVVGLLSLFVISGFASSEESFPGTYAALDQKRTTVTELMGVTAASSAAISLLPGDAGTPIAEQLADLSGYFMFILGAICLEKWMVTITGMLAFKILIPAACLILILGKLFFGDTWRSVGIKLICFALMMFAIVPASIVVTEKIDASYEASMEQMIEDTRNDTEKIQAAAEDEDANAIEKFVKKVKGGVSGQLDKFENTLNRMTESIAVLIVTSCVIPVAVIVFFIWLIKLLTGVSIQIPNMRISKMAWRKRPGLD